MVQGSAQTRPPYVAAATALGKCGASSSGRRCVVRSVSHPARANSGTQMQSSIMTSNPGLRPSRLMT